MSEAAPARDDLVRLVDRLWRPQAGGPVRVDLGPGSRPSVGWHVVEEYAVVPDLRRARFLVPTNAARAARAAFGPFHTTSSSRTRWQGRALAAGFGSGVAPKRFRDRLVVSVSPDLPRDQWADWLFLTALGDRLGVRGLVAFHPVRRATPNAKPTMRLFDRSGNPHGYAKLAWSAATGPIVADEATAMREVPGRLRVLQAPALRASGDWRGDPFTVAAPLPAGIRPLPTADALDARLLRDVVESGDVGAGPVAGSPYAHRWRRDLTAAAGTVPVEAQAVLGLIGTLEEPSDQLEHGRWHGDWVAWNLGSSGTRPVAWDWEYSQAAVPVGFDLVHWHFQSRLAHPQATLPDAVTAGDAAADDLGRLGVPASARRLVVSLYLAEMFTRAVVLAHRGAGWNPKIHPWLVEVASTRRG